MGFLTPSDYLAQIDQEQLDTLIDDPNGADILAQAETTAVSEIGSYLRGRYDVDAAFQAVATARNAQLVMMTVDVCLWHLLPRVTFRMVAEIRETRYKAAISWLIKAQDGKSNPDLPKYAAGTGSSDQAHRTFRYGSQPARSQSF